MPRNKRRKKLKAQNHAHPHHPYGNFYPYTPPNPYPYGHSYEYPHSYEYFNAPIEWPHNYSYGNQPYPTASRFRANEMYLYNRSGQVPQPHPDLYLNSGPSSRPDCEQQVPPVDEYLPYQHPYPESSQNPSLKFSAQLDTFIPAKNLVDEPAKKEGNEIAKNVEKDAENEPVKNPVIETAVDKVNETTMMTPDSNVENEPDPAEDERVKRKVKKRAKRKKAKSKKQKNVISSSSSSSETSSSSSSNSSSDSSSSSSESDPDEKLSKRQKKTKGKKKKESAAVLDLLKQAGSSGQKRSRGRPRKYKPRELLT